MRRYVFNLDGTLSQEPHGDWMHRNDVVALTLKAYRNATRAYNQGIAEGERREQENQARTFWAARLARKRGA